MKTEILLILVVLVLFSGDVMGFGISTPPNPKVTIDKNSVTYDISLQNMQNKTMSVVLNVSSTNENVSVQIINKRDVYLLKPYSNIPIRLKVKLPDNRKIGDNYTIYISVHQVSLLTGSENIKMSGKVSAKFTIGIIKKTKEAENPIKIPITLVIAIVIILILIYLLYPKEIKKKVELVVLLLIIFFTGNVYAISDALDVSTTVGDIIAPTTTANAVKNDSSSYTFNTWTNSNYVNVTLTCSDNVACNTTQYNLNGSGWMEYNDVIQISTEGNSTLEYRSNDTSGNLEDIKINYITIDKTNPEYNNLQYKEVVIPNEFQIINLTVTDSLSGVKSVWLEYNNSGSFYKFTQYGDFFNWSKNETTSGNVTIDIMIYDNAGNVLNLPEFKYQIGQSDKNITIVSVTPYETLWVGKNTTAYFNFSIHNNGTAPLTETINVNSYIDHSIWTNTSTETFEINNLPAGDRVYKTVNVTGTTINETTWDLTIENLGSYDKYIYTANLYVNENYMTPNNNVYYNISKSRLTNWDSRDTSLDKVKVDLTTKGVSYLSNENITVITDTTHSSSSLESGNHNVRIVYYVRINQANIEGSVSISTVIDKRIKLFLFPVRQILTITKDDGVIITSNQTIINGSTIELEPGTYTFCFNANGYEKKCFTDTITEDTTKKISLSSLTEQTQNLQLNPKNPNIILYMIATILIISVIFLIYPKEETEWVD